MSEIAAYNQVRAAMLMGGALLVVVVTIAARNSGAGAAASPSAPALQVAGARQYLGEVPAGTILRTRLQLANAGGRRLVVNEKICALCDADGLPTTIVSPGETRELELTWPTDGVHGPLQQSRTFTTNDPRQPRFEVQISAEVVTPSAGESP